MEDRKVPIVFRYEVSRKPNPEAEPEVRHYPITAFCQARERCQSWQRLDFQRVREGSSTEGYHPHTSLQLQQLNEEGEEEKSWKLSDNRKMKSQFGRTEPLARTLLNFRNAGMEWFAEADEQERRVFRSEADAMAFAAGNATEEWKLFNLDRFLDHLEGESIRHFLLKRPAISTNQLEILAGLGRGTLSKIKNGQRKLSRKQYGPLIKVLPAYGYEPHVDLRKVNPPEEPEADLEPVEDPLGALAEEE